MKLNDLKNYFEKIEDLPEIEKFKKVWEEFNHGEFEMSLENGKCKVKKVLATKAEELKEKIKNYLDSIAYSEKNYSDLVKADTSERP